MSSRNLLIGGLFTLFLTGLLLTCLESPVAAQRGMGRSPDRMFRWLDQNENGTLDEEELQRFAPLRDFMADRGVDLSQPLSLDDFANHMDRFRQKMQRRADEGGFGGGFGSRRDFESESFGNGGEGAPQIRVRSFGGGGFGGGFASGGFSNDDSDEDAPAATPEKKDKVAVVTPAKSKTSTNLKLPEAYRSKDKNGDGQIGLYEWPRNDLAAFRKLDLNSDGFITPQELARGPMKTTASSGSPTSGSASSGSTNSGSTSSSTTGSSGTPSTSSGSAAGGETAFNLLDKDKNGSVSMEEWDRSLSVRPKFEKQNLKPTLPINKEDFLNFYQQLKSS